MEIKVLEDFERLSKEASELIIAHAQEKPASLITFATGNSPVGVFKYLLKAMNEGRVNFSETKFVILDNFVGISEEDENSLYNSLAEEFFKPAGIGRKQIIDFNTRASDLTLECKRFDDIIFEHGGIDLILLGLGMNGHLGFNEPGASFENYTHVIELDETSKVAGQQYFKQSVDITKGITLGIKHILEAKVAIVIANGIKKADVVKKWLEGPVTEEMPVSALHLHSNAFAFLDEEAYSKIKK